MKVKEAMVVVMMAVMTMMPSVVAFFNHAHFYQRAIFMMVIARISVMAGVTVMDYCAGNQPANDRTGNPPATGICIISCGAGKGD